MKRSKLLILGFLMMVVLVIIPHGRANTQELAESDSEGVLAGVTITISVDWADKSLRDALGYIAEKSRVNIVADPVITDEDRVTVTFYNLEWHKVLEEIARLTGCVIEEVSSNLIRFNKPPKVKMNLKNAPIEEVIRAIAKLAGVNIIIATEVQGTVTMALSEIPWMNALEGVVKTGGFALVQEDYNLIRVVRPEALTAQLETRIFKLRYLKPPETYTAQIETIYAVGKPQPVQDAIKEFTLLNILRSMLTSRGGKTIGILEYDVKTNTIIVKDIKPVLDEMQKVIGHLDVEPVQVLIEVKYIVTSNEDLLNFGINYAWGDAGGFKMESSATPNNVATRLPFLLGHGTGDHSQSFLTKYEVTATLRLYKSDIKSKLTQVPSILTLDGRDATIFVGEAIHYAQTTASTNQYGGIEYSIAEAGRSPAKVGFQLLVIPHVIRENNQVMMTVIPQDEFLSGTSSDLVGFERFSVRSGEYDQYIDLPRIKQSVAVTNMVVKSGMTAVVGGLSMTRERDNKYKVPFFCDIPVLGNLFKYSENSITREHLIIFITPTILRTTQDITNVTQDKSTVTEEK